MRKYFKALLLISAILASMICSGCINIGGEPTKAPSLNISTDK